MTADLQRLGFTERAAEFLAVAGRHGGYFTRAQFAGFIQRKNGHPVQSFLVCGVRGGHFRELATCSRMRVYQIAGEELCGALGYRAVPGGPGRPEAVRAKLILLDFALAHQGLDWRGECEYRNARGGVGICGIGSSAQFGSWCTSVMNSGGGGELRWLLTSGEADAVRSLWDELKTSERPELSPELLERWKAWKAGRPGARWTLLVWRAPELYCSLFSDRYGSLGFPDSELKRTVTC